MIATRKGNTPVRKGDKLAGMRVIPLIIEEEKLQKAEQAAGDEPLLELLPYTKKTACIVTTGNEVKKGVIQDTFTPVVIDKLKAYGIETIATVQSGDGVENVRDAVLAMREKQPDKGSKKGSIPKSMKGVSRNGNHLHKPRGLLPAERYLAERRGVLRTLWPPAAQVPQGASESLIH